MHIGYYLTGLLIVVMFDGYRLMKLDFFSNHSKNSEFMKLRRHIGLGLLPQLKQTLAKNDTTSLTKHIKEFIQPETIESKDNGTRYDDFNKTKHDHSLKPKKLLNSFQPSMENNSSLNQTMTQIDTETNSTIFQSDHNITMSKQ